MSSLDREGKTGQTAAAQVEAGPETSRDGETSSKHQAVQIEATTSRSASTHCDRNTRTDFELALDCSNWSVQLGDEADQPRCVRYWRLPQVSSEGSEWTQLLISCSSHRRRVKFQLQSLYSPQASCYQLRVVPVTVGDATEPAEQLRFELSASSRGDSSSIQMEAELTLVEERREEMQIDQDQKPMEQRGNKNVTRFMFCQRPMSGGCLYSRRSLVPIVLHKIISSGLCHQPSRPTNSVSDSVLCRLAAAISLSHLHGSKSTFQLSRAGETARACCCSLQVTRHREKESTDLCSSMSVSTSSSTSRSSSASATPDSLSTCSLSRSATNLASADSLSVGTSPSFVCECRYSASTSVSSADLSSSCTSLEENLSCSSCSHRHLRRRRRARGKRRRRPTRRRPTARNELASRTAVSATRRRHRRWERPVRSPSSKVMTHQLRLKCPNCRMSFKNAAAGAIDKSRNEAEADSDVGVREVVEKQQVCIAQLERSIVTPGSLATPEEREQGAKQKSGITMKHLKTTQLDSKNLLNPMDSVWRGLSMESRALSCTEASLSDDSSSIVAQLAAAARSKSLCSEADQPRLKRLNQQQKHQQHRLNLPKRIRGCVGRLTRNAINHIKLLSASNPNIGQQSAKRQPSEDDTNRGANQSNYNNYRYSACERRTRSQWNLERGRCAAGQHRSLWDCDGMVVTHKLNRLGSSSAANLVTSSPSTQLRHHYDNKPQPDDQTPYYSLDGVYIGPGGILSRYELERQWQQQQAARQSRKKSGSSTISCLVRQLRQNEREAQAPSLGLAASAATSAGHKQQTPLVLIQVVGRNSCTTERDRKQSDCFALATANVTTSQRDKHCATSQTSSDHQVCPNEQDQDKRKQVDGGDLDRDSHLWEQRRLRARGVADLQVERGTSALGPTQSNGKVKPVTKPWLLSLTQRRHSNRASPPNSARASRISKKAASAHQKEPLEACESLKLSGSNSPSTHLTKEARSNSLSGSLGQLSQFASLSRSTMDLNFNRKAEQTSLCLAELNTRYSGNTHELWSAEAGDRFKRSSMNTSPSVLEQVHLAGQTAGELVQNPVGHTGQQQQAGSSSKVTELYGANLASICVHCQLIAELANYPASGYLSQLLATSPVVSQSSDAACGQLEVTAESPPLLRPSVVLTVCSNQATVELEDGHDECEVNVEQEEPIEYINNDSPGHVESAGRDRSERSSARSDTRAQSEMRQAKEFEKEKKGRRGSSCSGSLGNSSLDTAVSSSSSSQASGDESSSQALTDDDSAPILRRPSSQSSESADDTKRSVRQLAVESKTKLGEQATDQSDANQGQRQQERASKQTERRRARKEKGKCRGAKSAGFSNERREQSPMIDGSMLMVPCNKQARSASLDEPYLLKVPERQDLVSLFSLSALDGCTDIQPDPAASSSSNFLQQPPGAKSNRSRSVDISLPTQPGECYLVRQMAASGDSASQSALGSNHQDQVGAEQALLTMGRGGLKRRSTTANGVHMAAIEQKKFVQSEIKIPCANGETRSIKLFVNWQDDCINGEHLWIYAGSSSEACYVGENECSKHGPRLCCSACKITAHTSCISILIDKIKFICKHTFKDLTVSNQRHFRELQRENVIYHHWVHKRTHCGRCRQCTKTFGNTKLPFSSKEIQAITCSWCKVSYHNKENCYTLSALTEPCTLGVHRESIIPSTWIIKLPLPANKQHADVPVSESVSVIQDINNASKRQIEDNLIDISTATQQNAFKLMTENYHKENIEHISNRQYPANSMNKKNNHQQIIYGSNITLMTDTSGYMSADGSNIQALNVSDQNRPATSGYRDKLLTENDRNEIIIDPSALQMTDLSNTNQEQVHLPTEGQSHAQNHHYQQLDTSQQTEVGDNKEIPLFLNIQSMRPQQIHCHDNDAAVNQSVSSLYHNFKIVPHPIQGVPNAGAKPVLVFVNPRSGGNQGAKMMQKFNWLLNPRQVFDLIQSGGPRSALELYRNVPNLRILTIGGDGTASWILSCLDEVGIPNRIPVAVLPLGTGNDLARALGWGGGYADEPIAKILTQVRDGDIVQLDRWNLQVEKNFDAAPSSPNEFSSSSIYNPGSTNMELGSPSISSSPSYFGSLSQANNTTSSTISIIEQTNCDTSMNQGGNINALSGFAAPTDEAGTCDRLPMDVINNYFSFGVDAQIALEFHTAREAHPERFNSRLRNKMFYGQAGGKDLLKRKWKDLSNFVTLYCDGQDMTGRLKELKVHSVLFLNIPSYGGGTRPWPSTATSFAKPKTDDGLIEVIGLTTYQLPLLQAGGHGTCIAQCRNAKIITSRTIPMQVDGEPCKLSPSIININFKNRVCMLAKSKNSNKGTNMTSINMQKS